MVQSKCQISRILVQLLVFCAARSTDSRSNSNSLSPQFFKSFLSLYLFKPSVELESTLLLVLIQLIPSSFVHINIATS